MLETLLERPSSLNRHRKAPQLKEREEFLRHLQQQGTSRAALRNLSPAWDVGKADVLLPDRVNPLPSLPDRRFALFPRFSWCALSPRNDANGLGWQILLKMIPVVRRQIVPVFLQQFSP
jgi:hypothetical protein